MTTTLRFGRPRRGGAFVTLVLMASLCSPAFADGLANEIAACTTCHGEAGLPSHPNIPIISGQEFYYLYVQLKDFKAGRRQSTIMGSIAAKLSKGDMRALAQHFAERGWPSVAFTASAAEVSRGESATAAGLCVQCHLGGYEGSSRVPRLAGQQPAYLEQTMLDFKNKVRMNSPAKASLMAAYPDEDIAAMARYLADF